MKHILLSMALIFGSIPGLATLITNIGAPPGYGILFGSLAEVFGVLFLMVCYVNRSKLRRASMKRVTRWSLVLGSIALVLIVIYTGLVRHCVITNGPSSNWDKFELYFPIVLTGEAADLAEATGGRQAMAESVGPGGAQEAVHGMPNNGFLYFVTSSFLLILFVVALTMLTTAFGIAGFHLSNLLG